MYDMVWSQPCNTNHIKLTNGKHENFAVDQEDRDKHRKITLKAIRRCNDVTGFRRPGGRRSNDVSPSNVVVFRVCANSLIFGETQRILSNSLYFFGC